MKLSEFLGELTIFRKLASMSHSASFSFVIPCFILVLQRLEELWTVSTCWRCNKLSTKKKLYLTQRKKGEKNQLRCFFWLKLNTRDRSRSLLCQNKRSAVQVFVALETNVPCVNGRIPKKAGPLEAIEEEDQENVGPAEAVKTRTRVRKPS